MPAIIISGIVGAAIGAISTIVTGCCLKFIPYWKKENDDWENLDNTHINNVGYEAKKLTRKRFNIERRVKTANHGKNEATKGSSEGWRDWSEDADKKIVEWKKLMSEYEEAKKSCCKMCLCLSSTKLVAKMKNIEEKMQKLHEKMDVNMALTNINASTFNANRSFENRSEISWLDKNVENILKLLETKNKIGVHGEPYIGKTMILKALEDKAKKDCSFQEVFFVTMKKGEKEEQIRQHIAKQLEISIERVPDVIRSDKCLLILDQVSEDIELNMPADSPWKVLVVTRYLPVCTNMCLDDDCKVERMDEEDATRFFCQQINNRGRLPVESKNINKSSVTKIVNECGSMPQLIKVVAAYLQKCACDWAKFGEELVFSKVNHVYKTLEVVLEKISDDREKYYVHASLLPPEKDIFKDYLIECWWAHGCIKSDAENNLGHPLRTTRLTGHKIIQDLLERCFLFEGGEENCVRIPDICKDWVFETKKHVLSFVGNSQTEPDDVANAIHISLIDNNSICTLLWRCQNGVSSIIGKISDCVSLRVLDLSHTEIVGLPSTIFELANLKALYLNDCKGLRELPLHKGTPNTRLEILDICRSGIQAMPMGVAKLHGLKCLRVSLAILRSYDKTTRIIGGLKSLEEFTAVKDGNLEENWEGLASAIEDLARSKSLNVLWFTFPNASGLENFVRKSKSLKRKANLRGEKIFRSFKLLVDCPKKHHEVFIPQPTEFHLRIFKESSNRSLKVFSKVMKQTTSLELINHDTIEYLSSFGMDNIMELKVCVISGCEKMKSIIGCKGNFSALTTLTIKNCSELKVIFPTDVVKQIPSLKHLKVEKCQNTSMIFGGGGRSPAIVEAPLLESLELIDLQSLLSICAEDQLLVCSSLQEMMVQSCPSFQDSSLDKICTKSYVQLKCEEDLKEKLKSQETYFKCHSISAHQLESYDGGKKVDDGSRKGKDNDLLIHPKNHFMSKVSFCHMADISDFLKKHLSSGAIEKFRQTIFGWVLGLENMSVQAQLLHCLCLRESACRDVNAMLFKVGGNLLKFGLEEFTIMTGLKVAGALEYPIFEANHYRLTDRYFPGKSKFDRSYLGDVLLHKWVTDENDVVKIAVMLVIFCFFNTSRKKLSKEDFAIVESGQYVDYPWGLASYQSFMTSVKGKLVKTTAAKSGPPSDVYRYHYYVYGCPAAFCTWFYECCPRVNGLYAKMTNENVRPRMAKWRPIGGGKLAMGDLCIQIFDFPKLLVNNIVATEIEKEEFPLAVLRAAAIEREKLSSTFGSSSFRDPNENQANDDRWLTLSLEVKDMKKDFKTDFSKTIKGIEMKFDKLYYFAKERFEMLKEHEQASRSNIAGGFTSVPSGRNAQIIEELNDEEVFHDDADPDHVMAMTIDCENVEHINEYVETNDDVVEGHVQDKEQVQVEIVQGDHSDFAIDVVVQEKEQDAEQVEQPEKTVEKVDQPTVLKSIPKKLRLTTPINNKIKYKYKDIGNVGDIVSTKHDGRVRVLRGGFPFDNNISLQPVYGEMMNEVVNFVHSGTVEPIDDTVFTQGDLTKPIYLEGANSIAKSMDFHIATIDNKLWFFDLIYCGRMLWDSHINIFLYYLRKMCKYGKLNKKITTTDDTFDQKLSLFHEQYLNTRKEDRASIFNSPDNLLCRYMQGLDIWCGQPWTDVDHVLFPVHIRDHWILIRLDMDVKILLIYDSIRSKGHDQEILLKIARYTDLLPHFMRMAGIKIDITQFCCILVNNLPIQDKPDCGAFILAFAEYFAHDKMILVDPEFNIKAYRERLTCLLYHYARLKETNNVESDDEELLAE